MAAHVGPWRYEAATKTIRSVPENYWLASMNSWDGAVDHEANALVMAASAELLAVCKRLLAEVPMGAGHIRQLSAAISKAEG